MFDLCPRSALDTYICPALLTAGERLSLSQGASQSHPAGDEEDAASLRYSTVGTMPKNFEKSCKAHLEDILVRSIYMDST